MVKMESLMVIGSLFLIQLVAMPTFSQNLVVSYEENANIENQLKNVKDPAIRKRVSAHLLANPRHFTLYVNNGVSLFIEEAKKEEAKEKELSLTERKVQRIEIGKYDGGIYKNQKEKLYLRETSIFGKEFLVKDQLTKINWQLLDETKSIGDFSCKKAIATVNGEKIEAWYTSKIPVADGPSDFWGLPGLILELSTLKKTYHALTVDYSKTDFDLKKPSKGKEVTKEEYGKIRTEKINELKTGNAKTIIGG